MRKDYINLRYEPQKENELICKYYVEPAKGIKLEEAAVHIAGESSIDTWSEILTLSPKLAKELKPNVFSIDNKNKRIKIAYSIDLFELGSVAQLLSSIAGNIFSMKVVKNLRLEDVSFPMNVARRFKGPKFGIEGVRKVLKIKEDRPLIGTIVKPKVGLTSEKHSKVVYEAWVGGCDLVKDDENLTNQKFNPFKKRVTLGLKMRKKAEKETGERKMYLPNITAPNCQEMIKRAQFVKHHGGEYVMIDIIPTGWTALQTLREENEDLKLIIHAHRCMHSAFTRNPKHGISMLVIAKLTRLIGLDQLHIGTVVGKMHGSKEEVLSIRDACIKKLYHLKPLFPVSSGGLHPLMIPQLLKIFGNDAIFQFGGGIHAHPLGTKSGAKAVRDALYATMEGSSLEEYAKEGKSKELKAAIKKWGR
jgi:ribulose-bisphosphate carboxylase large chain